MSDNMRSVSIGEIIVSDNVNDVLVTYGLGSCVAICLYDPVARVGGMLHALLPTRNTPIQPKSQSTNNPGTKAKFVDQGVPLLIDSLLRLGAKHGRMIVRLCGGAQVLSAPGFEENRLKIGDRNVKAAEVALKAAGLKVRERDTGGTAGRTVKMRIADGQVTVRSLGQRERPLHEISQ